MRWVWRAALYLAGIGLAVLGFWLVATLAIYQNVRLGLALLLGLVPFGLVPLLVELRHRSQHRKYGDGGRWEAPFHRRILRSSLVANALLVFGLMVWIPKKLFTAAAVRGDWPVQAASPALRAKVLRLIDRTQDIVTVPLDDIYGAYDDAPAAPPSPSPHPSTAPPVRSPPPSRAPAAIRPTPTPTPTPSATAQASSSPKATPSPPIAGDVVTPTPGPTLKPTPTPSGEGEITVDPETGVPLIVMHGGEEPPPPEAPPASDAHRPGSPDHGDLHYADWLSDPKPSPLLAAMPGLFKTRYEDVAKYIAAHEPDAFERVKAVHDYIALNVDYEVPVDHQHLPPSEPEVVFSRRRAVCAGYARLFEAMMKVIGMDAVYISGDARFATDDATGASHAWNAVQVEGSWYLVDVTWDAGVIDGGRFKRRYSTDFLLAPPKFFVISHFPTRTDWQLVRPALTRGEFYRQPLLFPSFIAFALKLLSPERSQITVESAADVLLANPGGHSILVEYLVKGAAQDRRRSCAVEAGAKTSARCALPEDGEYSIYIFAALRGQVRHEVVAKLEVNRRG